MLIDRKMLPLIALSLSECDPNDFNEFQSELFSYLLENRSKKSKLILMFLADVLIYVVS